MAVYRHFGNRPKLFSLPISLVNDKGHYLQHQTAESKSGHFDAVESFMCARSYSVPTSAWHINFACFVFPGQLVQSCG